jgi:hypothetical protein
MSSNEEVAFVLARLEAATKELRGVHLRANELELEIQVLRQSLGACQIQRRQCCESEAASATCEAVQDETLRLNRLTLALQEMLLMGSGQSVQQQRRTHRPSDGSVDLDSSLNEGDSGEDITLVRNLPR